MEEKVLHAIRGVVPVILMENHSWIDGNVDKNQKWENVSLIETKWLLVFLLAFPIQMGLTISEKGFFGETKLASISDSVHP